MTLGSQGVMFVLQLGSTMILARILTPYDYGINAMAVAITGFANIFSNLGLSTATVQRSDITHEQVSTLFWINATIGVLLTLLVAVLSPAVVWFYNAPEMLWVILSLSIVFIINGLSVQHSALLTRQMRFYSIAKIRVLAMLSGILVAIVSASCGFGYWALVLNTLTLMTVSTLGFWFACGWVPQKPRWDVGVGAMVKFGADLVCFDVVNYFARNLDNILIGRFWGAGDLGLYSKAYQLLMMPITNLRDPLTNVALPAISRLQNNPENYRDYYLKCVSLLAFMSMPIIAFMFVCTDQLIILLLGSQWLGASQIFKILAVAAFIQPVSGTSGMILISTGQSRLYLKLGIFSAVIYCLSFVAGLPYGAKGVAAGYAIANYLLLFPMLFYTFKNTSVSVCDFMRTVFRPLVASITSGISLFIFLTLYSGYINIFLFIFLGSIVFLFIYIIAYLILPGGIDDLRSYCLYIFSIYRRKKK